MIDRIFYNIFVFGTLISVCISPILLFLNKNKYKYNLRKIYKILTVILFILIIPINTFNFSKIKNVFQKEQVIEQISETEIAPEILLDSPNLIVEYTDNIEIKNDSLFNFSKIIPYLWILVAAIVFLYNIFVYIIYSSNVKKYCKRKIIFELDNKINLLCEEMNLKNISYMLSEKITTPMVIGIFKKQMILPENIIKTKDYEMMIKHELVHIKNRDIELKLLMLILNSIYWFNPIIYKLIEQVEEVIELRCDDLVLENKNQEIKLEYAKILLNQIEENKQYRFSLNFANKRRNIMRRFSNIVENSKKRSVACIATVTAVLLVITTLVIVMLPNINFAMNADNIENNVSNEVAENTNKEAENIVSTENKVENEVVNSVTVGENKTTDVKKEETDNKPKDTIEKENTKVVKTKVTEIEEDKNTEKVTETKISNLNEETKVETSDKVVEEVKVTNTNVSANSINHPVEGEIVAGFYGVYKHTGIDIKSEEGTAIKAYDDGTVVYSGYKGSYGNLVVIEHKDGIQTYYAHNKENLVQVGDTVQKGQEIAKVGSTGNSTGPHLHLEMRIDGTPVNPMPYLKK